MEWIGFPTTERKDDRLNSTVFSAFEQSFRTRPAT